MNLKEFYRVPGLPKLGLAYFFLQMQFWFPIWVLFLLERDISLSEIVIADMVFWASVIIFEVPAGMIGDRLGRKKTYFIGALLGAMSYALMIYIIDFYWLIICWICWSIYIAIVSGTDTAYIYELLKEENQSHQSTYVFGYFASITSLAFIITHFSAGFFYGVDPILPIFLNVIVSLFAALIILTLPTPKKGTYTTPSFNDIFNAMKEQFFSNDIVKYVVMLMAVIMMYHWTVTLIFQPFLIELGFEVEFFGFVYLIFTVLGILGGFLAGPLEKRFGKIPVLVTSLLLVVSAVGFTGLIPGIISVGGIMILRAAFYLGDPILKVILNREVEDAHRASIFSFSNMLYSSILFFSRPLVGLVSDMWSSKSAFQLWFVLGIPMAISLLFLIRKLSKAEKRKYSN
jgi:MFS family permease